MMNQRWQRDRVRNRRATAGNVVAGDEVAEEVHTMPEAVYDETEPEVFR